MYIYTIVHNGEVILYAYHYICTYVTIYAYYNLSTVTYVATYIAT